MRTPQDLPARAPRTKGRARWWIIGAVVVLIILLASLKSLATLYTDSLWFSSVQLHDVWSTLLAVKVGLFASFGAIFFVGLWVNLMVCDRIGIRTATLEPDDELVRRYQQAVRPYSRRIYAAISLVLALIAASGTVGEWNNWILFTHAQSFGVKDPQFGMDVGFFVFRLPFLQFLVDWGLIVLVVMLVVTAIFHYLNGGIRAQRTPPRVRPAVKVHLSVLLALIALVKAAGYVLQRFQLDTSTNGYVEGVGYTDAHARLPALEVLFFISLFAAAILLYNIRRQGWTLPVLAIGIWAFVALVIGVIYPAVLQVLKVNPAQSTLEQPYIKRNIAATRAAYGVTHVKQVPFDGSTTLPANAVADNATTLANIRLWDPDPSISLPTFQKLQGLRSYYQFQTVGVDRYTVDGTLRPALVGVRQLNPNDLPSTSWVNTHLQYTHGEGIALAQANQTTSNGNPVFSIKDIPPVSAKGLPTITQPDVYFGLNDPGYVVADSKQAELDYQKDTGTDVETHYQGTGGVKMGSFFTRAAFAVRLGDIQPLDLRPDHASVEDHVRPHNRRHGPEGGAVPQLRRRPVLGRRRRPHRLGPRRVHDDRRVPVLAERRYPTGPTRQRPAEQLQLRSQLRQDRHRRLQRVDDVLRHGQRPDPPGLRVGVPAHVHASIRDAGGPGCPPAVPRGSLLGPGRRLRPLPHHVAVELLHGR